MAGAPPGAGLVRVEAGPELARLARASGVATGYLDWAGRPVRVQARVVAAVLTALGSDPSRPGAELARLAAARRADLLPPTVATSSDRSQRRPLPRPADAAEIVFEDGERRPVALAGGAVLLPRGLPPGWHELRVRAFGGLADRWRSAVLVVAPARVPVPGRPLWGWSVQLYGLRSATSWGMGDYADLARFAAWAGGGGADLVLVNPLHAEAPVVPVETSPYYPGSRRFPSVLSLHPESLPEFRAATAAVREEVARLRAGLAGEGLVDRDAVWTAKAGALELLAPPDLPMPPAGPLRDVATFHAIAEREGRDFRRWPAAAGAELRRVAWHAWLLAAADTQLGAAGAAGRVGGLGAGIMHDLAVGVDPGGADAYTLPGALVADVTIGAPPDSFNQQGQDWQMCPWHPSRLAELGYAPVRDVMRAVLRHGGGVRVDHVLGLFRTWWIPRGNPASAGTYVQADAEALLAVLTLEAHRAGALVVGEDLGTVTDQVQVELGRRGILGSTVLWFTDGAPESWRAQAAASVTTHDLPTTAGWLAGDHVRLRHRLGLLGRDLAEEQQEWADQRESLLAELRRRGWAENPVVGLHRMLAASPSRVLFAQLADAVGDRRQPNLPGTTDAYPNWRLPLADATGTEVTLEALHEHPGPPRLAEVLQREHGVGRIGAPGVET